jgi:hypothetical protein
VDAIRDLVDSRAFGDGVIAGALAFGIVLAIVWATHRRRADFAGLGFAAAGLAALAGTGPLRGTGDVPRGLLVGLVLVALGGGVLRLPRVPSWTACFLYAPGALVIGYATDLTDAGAPDWARPAIAAAIAIGGALAFDLDRARARDAIGPVLFAISVAGVYATVPDTEHAAVLVGAALPLLAYAVPTAIGSLGPEGTGAAIGLLMWVTAIDGRGRPGSIVGAIGCLGLLLAEPIGRRLAPRRYASSRRLPREWAPYEHWILLGIFAGLQVGITAYASRVAGAEKSASTALLYLVPALAAAVVVATGVPPPTRAHRRRRTRV